jgi:hypothetical protein
MADVDSRTLPDLPNKKGKTNWVEKAGGLPSFIERVAKHIRANNPKYSLSRVIASAVSQVKKMAAKGNKEAAAAVAQWEAMKAKTHAVNASVVTDADMAMYLSAQIDAQDDAEFDVEAYELALSAEREARGLETGDLDDETEVDGADDFDYGRYLLALNQERQVRGLSLSGMTERPLNLAIQFDPKEHPRDLKGRFREILGGLQPGQRVDLPDGTSVRKESRGPGYTVTPTGKHDRKGGLHVATTPDEAIDQALDYSARKTHRDSVGGKESFASHRDVPEPGDAEHEKKTRDDADEADFNKRVDDALKSDAANRSDADLQAEIDAWSAREPSPLLEKRIAANKAEQERRKSGESKAPDSPTPSPHVKKSDGDGPDAESPAEEFQRLYGGGGGGKPPARADGLSGDAARDADIAGHIDQILDNADYDDDEATEYGDTPEEKALGVAIDTGALTEELRDISPDVESADWDDDGNVKVEFKDGSEPYVYKVDQRSGSATPESKPGVADYLDGAGKPALDGAPVDRGSVAAAWNDADPYGEDNPEHYEDLVTDDVVKAAAAGDEAALAKALNDADEFTAYPGDPDQGGHTDVAKGILNRLGGGKGEVTRGGFTDREESGGILKDRVGTPDVPGDDGDGDTIDIGEGASVPNEQWDSEGIGRLDDEAGTRDSVEGHVAAVLSAIDAAYTGDDEEWDDEVRNLYDAVRHGATLTPRERASLADLLRLDMEMAQDNMDEGGDDESDHIKRLDRVFNMLTAGAGGPPA